MADTRRLFVRSAIAAAGGLMAVPYFPRRSFADCTMKTRLLGFGAHVDTGTGVTSHSLHVNYWNVGDCELAKADIKFVGGVGTFDGYVGTKFTHNKDIWRFRLRLAAPGGPTKFDQTWNGPEMSEKDNPRFHHWYFRFSYDAALDFGPLQGFAESCC